jgi:NAD(P)-dependent dehydrogenase (short-subunit alcohol dehydrogenase family)
VISSDLGDPGSLARIARRVRGELGAVDILVNNAGWYGRSDPDRAELADSGVTVNVFRPGPVGTPVQGWIRGQDPARIGAALHDRFSRSCEAGILVAPEHSARSLLAHLDSDATGQTWDVPARHERSPPSSGPSTGRQNSHACAASGR